MSKLRDWAKALKREVVVLWLAARDRRTPMTAKLLAFLVAGYALSPIDLIPDFIPVIGLLDDLLLVPAGIWLTLRLLPPDLLAEFRAVATDAPWPMPSSIAAVLVLATWIAAICWFWGCG